MATDKKTLLQSGLSDVLGSFANKTPVTTPTKKTSAPVPQKKETAKKEEESPIPVKKTPEKKESSDRRVWSFRIKEEIYQKITAIAWWDRKNIQEVMDEFLDSAVTEYEKKNGKIKPIQK